MLQKLAQGTLTFDWSNFHARGALLCLPAIAVPLLVGLSIGPALAKP